MSIALPEPSLPSAAVTSVLVVGAGLAGLRTVQALRQRGFAGDITVVGQEELAPYDRPPLSKHLFDHDSPVFLSEDLGADLTSLADTWVRGGRAVALGHSGSRWALTVEGAAGLTSLADSTGSGSSAGSGSSSLADDPAASQQILTADAVVLAVGAQPIKVAGWSGVSHLHSWHDAVDLREQLRDPSKLVIIGAGWIGSEVASVAAQAGHTVTVIEADDFPLARQLGPEVGKRMSRWFAQAGVDLHLQTRVLDTGANGQTLVEFQTSDGQIHQLNGDVVVSAIGVRPNTEWLEGTVTRNAVGAVIADSFGRVLLEEQVAPQLFAVGDCAVRQDDVHGWIPGGHWNTALSDPERVAAAILDDQAAPPSVAPYVFSTQFGKDLSFFGDLPHEPYDVVFRDYSPQSWTALYLLREPAERGKDSPVAVTEQRAVAAVLTVNAPRDASQARKLLARGAFVVATDNLSDLAKQLKQL